jgi:VWFA-related protein
MIQPLITGQRGVAAVLAHDSELRLVQGFTADPFAITDAFAKLEPVAGGSRMLDAAGKAIGMLSRDVPNHRRVLLLIGESRDGGSESKLEHVLTDAQVHNVAVYSLTWSAFLSAWVTKPGEVPPPQGGMNDLLALFRHLSKQGKENAAEQLTEYTGGRRLFFVRQGALEQAVAAIGEELHSQYLLSFSPRPEDRVGFHSIQVRVPSRPNATVRTRPGYWLSAPE